MATERVIFRKWKGNGDVIAFFPDQPDGPYLMSYEHIGQHGRASYPHPHTEPAPPEEYAPLLAELRSIGYTDLKIVTRVTRSRKCGSGVPLIRDSYGARAHLRSALKGQPL